MTRLRIGSTKALWIMNVSYVKKMSIWWKPFGCLFDFFPYFCDGVFFFIFRFISILLHEIIKITNTMKKCFQLEHSLPKSKENRFDDVYNNWIWICLGDSECTHDLFLCFWFVLLNINTSIYTTRFIKTPFIPFLSYYNLFYWEIFTNFISRIDFKIITSWTNKMNMIKALKRTYSIDCLTVLSVFCFAIQCCQLHYNRSICYLSFCLLIKKTILSYEKSDKKSKSKVFRLLKSEQ